jgi:[ribosomal protein S5]-alanine N-acetyltransferase
MNKKKLFSDFPNIKSDNIILRKTEVNEFQQWYDMIKNTNQDFTPSKNKNLGKEAAYNVLSEHYVRDFEKKKQIFLGIYLEDLLVGNTVIFDVDEKVDMVSIGYSLSGKNCGKGIATRAVGALVKFLFDEINVNRIQAFVMPENKKSTEVLEKNSFIKEGVIRKGYYWTGHGIIDLEVYAILYCDYIE